MDRRPPSVSPSDDYELVPKSQLDYLRAEVERIKRNPFGDTQSSKDLLTGLDALNRNIAKLIAIFETADEEIVRDYKENANSQKLLRILEQNEKLAKGIIAIADLVKEREGRELPPSPEQPPVAPSVQALPRSANPFLPEESVPVSEPLQWSDVPPPPR